MENQNFDTQMERIKLITGKRTQIELADFFGIRQSSISDAKRRGKIPSGWLVILMRVKNVHPEWILTRTGPCFMVQPIEDGHYETRSSRSAKWMKRRFGGYLHASWLMNWCEG